MNFFRVTTQHGTRFSNWELFSQDESTAEAYVRQTVSEEGGTLDGIEVEQLHCQSCKELLTKDNCDGDEYCLGCNFNYANEQRAEEYVSEDDYRADGYYGGFPVYYDPLPNEY